MQSRGRAYVGLAHSQAPAQHGLCARDLAQCPRHCQKHNMEKRIRLRLLGSVLLGGVMFGCSEGGQTYDDGADGLGDRRTPPVVVAGDSSSGMESEELVADSAPRVEPDTPVLAPSPVPGTSVSLPAGASRCDVLEVQADTQVENAFHTIQTSCSTDTDCQAFTLPHATCSWGWVREACPSQGAIVPSSLTELESKIAQVESTICAEMRDLDCPPVAPPLDPCLPLDPMVAWCDVDHCSLRFAVSCEEAYAPAWAAVEDLYDSADRSCDVDADCALFTSGGVSCTPGFAARCDSKIGVNVDAVAVLEEALDYVDEQDCDGYVPLLCTPSIDPIECPDVQSARCIEQQCVAVMDGDAGPNAP